MTRNNDDHDLPSNEFRDEDFRNDDLRDDDLRARFAALRQEEAAQTPEFRVVPRRADHSRRRSVGTFIAVAACLVAMVAGIFWLKVVLPQRDGNRVASITEWKAPTDFLLETPGRDLLRTVPAIGSWHDYTQVSKPGKEQLQLRKQNSH